MTKKAKAAFDVVFFGLVILLYPALRRIIGLPIGGEMVPGLIFSTGMMLAAFYHLCFLSTHPAAQGQKPDRFEIIEC